MLSQRVGAYLVDRFWRRIGESNPELVRAAWEAVSGLSGNAGFFFP